MVKKVELISTLIYLSPKLSQLEADSINASKNDKLQMVLLISQYFAWF